jgi:PPK2 family polyphosphate:nucleotide phosphotransferase
MNFAERYRAGPGTRVKLTQVDAGDTAGYHKSHKTKAELARVLGKLDEMQRLLYADKRYALLIVLQGIDGGGKDGTIRHVMSGLNPQGCRVTSFKAPTEEEKEHDFLWRVHKVVPRLGEIGIFNRSHYEDVLIARVHNLAPKDVWSRRYDEINQFEKFLTENGTIILKFFLHISKEEQKKRLEERIDDPTKEWKLSLADFQERKYWGEYQLAYEEALARCSTRRCPWFIIPANHRWFRNLAISHIILRALESLKMKYPKPAVDVAKLRLF